jgi:hypothetical protein
MKRVYLAVMLTLIAVALPSSARAAHFWNACGDKDIPSYSVMVRDIKAHEVSCHNARKVAKYWAISRQASAGFSCVDSGHTGDSYGIVSCRKSQRRVKFQTQYTA